MKQYRIRKNDKVKVTVGKDKDKVGKVLKILKKKDKVLVEGVNIAKRHTKPNPYAKQQGGILEKEMPIHISNVMVVCDKCNEAARIGYRTTDDDKKVRFCKKCNENMD
ncbi:MAG: 50S ribosomal protein L24 [Desulfovibrio sp.]